jgi:hypothetical protein
MKWLPPLPRAASLLVCHRGQSCTIALCYRVLQMGMDSLENRYKNTLPAPGYEWISTRELTKDEVASLDMPLVPGLGWSAEATCFTGMYA